MDKPSSSSSSILAVEVEEEGSLLIISRTADGTLQENEDKTLTILAEDFQTNHANSHEISNIVNENKPETVNEDSCSATLEGLDELMVNELKNLNLVRKVNSSLRKMISTSTTSLNEQTSSEICDVDVKKAEVENIPKTPQSMAKKLGTLRRRKSPKLSQTLHFRNMNVQKFIQDYYRSLDTVSRYIILAAIIGFCTAFILLSLYSYQIHTYDIQRFKLQEEQVFGQQSLFQKSQMKHENFRENMIHQKFEETRECHSTLKTCITNRESLLVKISKFEEETTFEQSKLNDALATIKDLQKEIKELKDINKGLRAEIGQSISYSFSQVVFGIINILRNNSVQIIVGTFASVVTLFIIFTTVSSK